MEYPLVRVDKLHPDGSPRASLYGYRIPDHDGIARVWVPSGTRRIHVNGFWRHDDAQVFGFDPRRRYVVTWSLRPTDRSLYVDVAREMSIGRSVLAYVDLYLDVMLLNGVVREKDEELLSRLDPAEAAQVRQVRDEIRRGIQAGDPLLDPDSALWSVPPQAELLPPRMRRRTKRWLSGHA